MRDVILLVLLGGVLPFAFLRPWIGLLTWVVLGIAAPHQLGWWLSGQPVAAIVATAVLIGYPLFAQRTGGIPMRLPVVLLLAFWAWTVFTSVTGFYPEVAMEELGEHSKALLFVMLAFTLFQDRTRLHALFGVLAGALGFFAVKGALFSLASGAQYIVWGPENTIFYDNNDFALALNMLLPLALFLMRSAESRMARLAWMGVAGGMVLSILFTYSRGGAVALAALIAVTVLRSKQRIPAIAVGVVVLVAATLLAPPAWMERIQSISDYENDGSATGRLAAWGFAWNLAVDNPVTGGGFGVYTGEMYARYAPGADKFLVAHSVWFDLLATQGFTGLALYLALLGSMLWRAGRLRRRALRAGERWFAGASEAIQLSLIAFMVGGTFLSQTWNEIFFYLVVAQVMLEGLAEPVLEANREPLPLWRPEAEPCAA